MKREGKEQRTKLRQGQIENRKWMERDGERKREGRKQLRQRNRARERERERERD